MTKKPRGRPPAQKKRKGNETDETTDSGESVTDYSQTEEHAGETELAGTDDGAVGGAIGGAIGGAEGGAEGGADTERVTRSGARTPAGAMETGRVTNTERGELQRVLKILDKRNERTARELNQSHGTNSTRVSRANSPAGNTARLHQENLNRWEALGARQTNVEKEMKNMSQLLVEITKKINEAIGEPQNRPNGNPPSGRLGNLTERLDQNSRKETGTVPKRSTRSILINNDETPEDYQSEFARTLNQTIGGTVRPDSEERDGEEEVDNFDRFYINNRTVSGPPTIMNTPVTRNETHRYDEMYRERERERRELRHSLFDEQIVRNSNLLSIQNRTQTPQTNLYPRRSVRDENLSRGSRLDGNNPQSRPSGNSQNIIDDNTGSRPGDDSKHAGQVLRNCPEWTGPSSGVTFRDWIQSMRNRMKFGPALNDEWKKLMVFEKLKEMARTMAGEEMNPGIESNLAIQNYTFEEYVAKLAEKLDPAQNLQRLRIQLENRRQRADEPVDFYLLSVTNQWKKIYTPLEQSRSEIRENLCKVFKNSLINPMLRKKAREFHMYVNPPNDYEQLHKAILTEARLIREMVTAGDLSSDKEVGAKEHLDYEQYKGENTKSNSSKLNSIEEGEDENCEVNFVKNGNWNKDVSQSFQKKRFFKPNNRFVRIKNQNVGMKGRCFWCGDENHFVRDCPRKAKGLDRTVNGLKLEEECVGKGFEIDGDGMICVEVHNGENGEEMPNSYEPDPQVNALVRNRQNMKKNDNRRQGGYFRKRQARFKRNNQFKTVTVISHFDEDDKLIDEIVEEEENGAQESAEIQSLDLTEIFENNFNIGALDYEGQIEEEIFTGLENQTNSREAFSGEFVINTIGNFEDYDERLLEQLSLEENQISELDCERLDEYF